MSHEHKKRTILATLGALALLGVLGVTTSAALAAHDPYNPYRDPEGAHYDIFGNPVYWGPCEGPEGGILDVAADADDLQAGLYPPSSPSLANKGKWDIAFQPQTAYSVGGPVGGGTGCAFQVNEFPLSAPHDDLGKEPITVTTAGMGEKIRCANPKNTSEYCTTQRASGYPAPYNDGNGVLAYGDLADGTYIGKGKSDTWCEGTVENTLCSWWKFYNNIWTWAYIDYNTGDTPDNPGTNHCTTSVVLCAEARIEIGPEQGPKFECNGDITYKYKPASGKLLMSIYEPTCNGDNYPMYVTEVKELAVCAYGNETTGHFLTETCGDASTDPDKWVSLNGGPAGDSGTFILKSKITHTDTESCGGTGEPKCTETYSAKKKVTWS